MARCNGDSFGFGETVSEMIMDCGDFLVPSTTEAATRSPAPSELTGGEDDDGLVLEADASLMAAMGGKRTLASA